MGMSIFHVCDRNYEFHQRFSDAADLMVSLATQGQGQFQAMSMSGHDGHFQEDIYKRMEFLSYAIHSGQAVVNHPAMDASLTTAVLTMDVVSTMNDQLAVASKWTEITVNSINGKC